MRISQENEDRQGAASHQPPPPQGSQTAVCLKFPRKARLTKPQEYQALRRAGRRFPGSFVVFEYRRGLSSCPRLGITVSRKYGKAHLRNRFKRLVREAFRASVSALPSNFEVNVSPRQPSLEPTKAALIEDFLSLSKVC